MSLYENVSAEAKQYGERLLNKARLEWDEQWEDQVADMRGEAFDSIVRAALAAGSAFFILGMIVGAVYF